MRNVSENAQNVPMQSVGNDDASPLEKDEAVGREVECVLQSFRCRCGPPISDLESARMQFFKLRISSGLVQ